MKYIKEYALFENTLKKAKEEFRIKIGEAEFDFIVERDPSPNKKYVYWISKYTMNRDIPVAHLIDLVKWHFKNQQKMPIEMRDINKITPEDIENMQQDPRYQSKKDQKELLKSDENYKIIYEDNKGNKVIELLNRFGCTFWTQYEDNKLKKASFCIGSYNNKDEYDYYSQRGKSIYMVLLPDEIPDYRKIVFTPDSEDIRYYDVTNMKNQTTSYHKILDFAYENDPPSTDWKGSIFTHLIEKTLNKYKFIENNIPNINILKKKYYDEMSHKKYILDLLNLAKEKYGSIFHQLWYGSGHGSSAPILGIRLKVETEYISIYLTNVNGDLYHEKNFVLKDFFNQKPKDLLNILHDAYIKDALRRTNTAIRKYKYF